MVCFKVIFVKMVPRILIRDLMNVQIFMIMKPGDTLHVYQEMKFERLLLLFRDKTSILCLKQSLHSQDK